MTRKDIDPLHPVIEWELTPSGAVGKWHGMGPKVAQVTGIASIQYRSLPKGGVDQMRVWHTIDFRNGPHWIPEPGFETEFQPNIRIEDIPWMVSGWARGVFLTNRPIPDKMLRVICAFRRPGSGLGDPPASGVPEAIQSEPLGNDGSSQQGSRTDVCFRIPIADGKTEMMWWGTADNAEPVDLSVYDMSMHFQLQSYDISAAYFWQRMTEIEHPPPSGGGWDEARIAGIESNVSALAAQIAGMQTSVDANAAAVAIMQPDVGANTAAVAALTPKVASLETWAQSIPPFTAS